MLIRPEIQKIADNADKFKLSTSDCFKFETKENETNILVDISYGKFSSRLRKFHNEEGLIEIELNLEESYLLFDIFHKINCQKNRERDIRYKIETKKEKEETEELKKQTIKSCLNQLDQMDFNSITKEK